MNLLFIHKLKLRKEHKSWEADEKKEEKLSIAFI